MLGLWADVLRGLLGHIGLVPAYLARAANGLLFNLLLRRPLPR
jgi:hypothetical protein